MTNLLNKDSLCLVVATNHDYVSGVLLESAVQVAQNFQDQGYEVFEVLGVKATAEEVYTTLMAIRKSKKRITIASFSGHACNDGVYDADSKMIVDKHSGKSMSSAIVLLQSCLEDGHLPLSWVSSPTGVKACIGFAPKLFIPQMNMWKKLFKPSVVKRGMKDFKACLMVPSRSLIMGQSTAAAVRMAKQVWKQSSYSFMASDLRLAMVFAINERSLCLWENAAPMSK